MMGPRIKESWRRRIATAFLAAGVISWCSAYGDDGGDGAPIMVQPQAGGGSKMGRPHGKGHRGKTIIGSYNAEARGVYFGAGAIVVSSTSLRINLNVQDDGGKSGTLSAVIPLNKGRFSGVATAMGQQVTLDGRVDYADDPNGIVRIARVSGTFAAANGHFGRITGQYASKASS